MPAEFSPAAEMVVLLHGVASSHWQMSPLAARLKRDGYDVVNLAYPSRSVTIEKLAAKWLPAHLRECEAEAAPRVHFVTHSMGGIVLRQWIARSPRPDNLGRVVMIAPPNAGSEVSDRLAHFPPYHWIIGVNAGRLGTRATDLPRALGPWPADAPPLGIIAGDRSFSPLSTLVLPGRHDGKVTVASTRLEGMKDGIVLHHSHTLLPFRADTIAQVRRFLRDGEFDRHHSARG
jgi:pimeloyl-ACP methyl ester carboxylesterase